MILAPMPDAIDFLLRAQNPDGGWGYRAAARGVSYVEPTAAVMIALRDANAAARDRAREFLLRLQLPDGGWGIGALDPESGWMTAWAVRALSVFPENNLALEKGARWLIKTSGITLSDPTVRAKIRELFRMDSTLRGWPWQVGDAAWVHPTALALLALDAAKLRDHARYREGVAYLLDRATDVGGWNIGNPQMIDKKIPATIQDSAIALLALRAAEIPADDARIRAAIQYLRDAVARAATTAELGFGILALDAWGIEVNGARVRLNALQKNDGSWDRNPFLTAIAMSVQ
ncbi:MAG: hypothetical protein HY327_07460 [Chloroflexi bacterium]|nr:hypothetical protein [Chloroflexota bacterium]